MSFSIASLYRISHKAAIDLNRYAHPYFDKGSDERNARLGDKLTHIMGKAKVVGSSGTDHGGYANARFSFTKLGLDPPFGGAGQVLVFTSSGGLLENDVDYTLTFDYGEGASTPDYLNPTRAASYLDFQGAVADDEKITVIVF